MAARARRSRAAARVALQTTAVDDSGHETANDTDVETRHTQLPQLQRLQVSSAWAAGAAASFPSPQHSDVERKPDRADAERAGTAARRPHRTGLEDGETQSRSPTSATSKTSAEGAPAHALSLDEAARRERSTRRRAAQQATQSAMHDHDRQQQHSEGQQQRQLQQTAFAAALMPAHHIPVSAASGAEPDPQSMASTTTAVSLTIPASSNLDGSTDSVFEAATAAIASTDAASRSALPATTASTTKLPEALIATVHRTDVLRPMPHLLRPFVRVRAMDTATGRCLATLRRRMRPDGSGGHAMLAAAARRAAARLSDAPSDATSLQSTPGTPLARRPGTPSGASLRGSERDGGGGAGGSFLRPPTPGSALAGRSSGDRGRPGSRRSLRRLGSWSTWRKSRQSADMDAAEEHKPRPAAYEDDAIDTPPCLLPAATNVLPNWECPLGLPFDAERAQREGRDVVLLFELVDTVSAPALRGLRRQPRTTAQGGWHTPSLRGGPGMRDWTHAVAFLHLRAQRLDRQSAAASSPHIGHKLRLQLYRATKGRANTAEANAGDVVAASERTRGRGLFGWLKGSKPSTTRSTAARSTMPPSVSVPSTATRGDDTEVDSSSTALGSVHPGTASKTDTLPVLPGCPQPWRWFCDPLAREKLPISLHVTLRAAPAAEVRRLLGEVEEQEDHTDDNVFAPNSKTPLSAGATDSSPWPQPVWQRPAHEPFALPDTTKACLWPGAAGSLAAAFSQSGALLALGQGRGGAPPPASAPTIAGPGSPPVVTATAPLGADDVGVTVYAMTGAGQAAAPQAVLTLQGHRGLVYDLDWSRDDSVLASASADGRALLWDITARRTTPAVVLSHPCYVYAVRLRQSPANAGREGLLVLTGAFDGAIRLWDARFTGTGTEPGGATRRQRYTGRGSTNPNAYTAHNGPNGHNGLSGRPRLEDGARLLAIVPHAHVGPINALALDRTHAKLFSAGASGVVNVWSLPAVEAYGESSGVGGASTGGSRLHGTASDGQQPHAAPQLLRSIDDADTRGTALTSLSLHPSGKRLLVHARDGLLRVLNLTSYLYMLRLVGVRCDRAPGRAALSTCGSYAAAGSDDGSVTVWSAHTGQVLRRFCNLAPAPVAAVAFHPVDNLMVCTGYGPSAPTLVLEHHGSAGTGRRTDGAAVNARIDVDFGAGAERAKEGVDGEFARLQTLKELHASRLLAEARDTITSRARQLRRQSGDMQTDNHTARAAPAMPSTANHLPSIVLDGSLSDASGVAVAMQQYLGEERRSSPLQGATAEPTAQTASTTLRRVRFDNAKTAANDEGSPSATMSPARTPGSARQRRWQTRQSTTVGSSSEDDNLEDSTLELQPRSGAWGVPSPQPVLPGTTATPGVEPESAPAKRSRATAPASAPGRRVASTASVSVSGMTETESEICPRPRRSRAGQRSRRRALAATADFAPSRRTPASASQKPLAAATASSTYPAPAAWGAPGEHHARGAAAMAVDEPAESPSVFAPAGLEAVGEAPSRRRAGAGGAGRRRNRFGSDSDDDTE